MLDKDWRNAIHAHRILQISGKGHPAHGQGPAQPDQRGHEGLTQTPPKGDIKPMEGKPSGRYRLRVGGYRVIYRYDHNGVMTVLYILDVGPRGDIYK